MFYWDMCKTDEKRQPQTLFTAEEGHTWPATSPSFSLAVLSEFRDTVESCPIKPASQEHELFPSCME